MSLKMPDVKPPVVTNFLFYFNLATANVVIAYIHFAVCIILILEFFYFLIFNESEEVKIENVEVKVKSEDHDAFTDTFDIIIRLIILVVTVFVTFITFWYIRGIKMCEPTKMKPYLFFTGTFVFLCCCAAVATLNFITLMIGVVELYFFICAYSWYLSLLSDPNISQDVVYKNPSAHGYAQAFEPESYANGGANYYPQQQQPQQTDGYYNQQDFYEESGQEQQQQYHTGQ